MILRILAVITVAVIFWAIFEWILHRLNEDNEASRKLLHIIHGVGLAVMAFVAPLWAVAIVDAIFLALVIAGRYIYKYKLKYIGPLQYLGKLYKVGRPSYGELLFPLSVIATAFIAHSEWEFAAAMLVLALADSAAALIGKRYGKKTAYKILGQNKSIIGSAAFYVVTLTVVAGYIRLGGPGFSEGLPLALLWMPIVITAAENLGVYGSDNLLIPIVAVLLLNML